MFVAAAVVRYRMNAPASVRPDRPRTPIAVADGFFSVPTPKLVAAQVPVSVPAELTNLASPPVPTVVLSAPTYMTVVEAMTMAPPAVTLMPFIGPENVAGSAVV